jgi:hemoglobin
MRFAFGKVALAGVLVAGLAVSACTTKKEPPASLYDRLGGLGPITGVVDTFVANVAADERINARFANASISRLKIRLVQQVCEASGGPCKYQGQPMAVAHQGMNITADEFNAMGEDMAKALDELKVPAKEKGEVLALLGSMQNEIVGK